MQFYSFFYLFIFKKIPENKTYSETILMRFLSPFDGSTRITSTLQNKYLKIRPLTLKNFSFDNFPELGFGRF